MAKGNPKKSMKALQQPHWAWREAVGWVPMWHSPGSSPAMVEEPVGIRNCILQGQKLGYQGSSWRVVVPPLLKEDLTVQSFLGSRCFWETGEVGGGTTGCWFLFVFARLVLVCDWLACARDAAWLGSRCRCRCPASLSLRKPNALGPFIGWDVPEHHWRFG